MGYYRSSNIPRSSIETAIVATLLGMVAIANAGYAPQPLQTVDIIVGVIFIITGLILSLKREES
jgi:cytochrome c biogenesis protein CcdA